ncbi:MAG: hypothetical protein WEA56_13525, partial [Balneolaceae bacterium]
SLLRLEQIQNAGGMIAYCNPRWSRQGALWRNLGVSKTRQNLNAVGMADVTNYSQEQNLSFTSTFRRIILYHILHGPCLRHFWMW